MTPQKPAKLSVENFGPVRSGEVELKRLTIFIGPNNSGKSYMALLAYEPQFAIAQAPQRLVPLILRAESLHIADLQIINRNRISFRGKHHPIKSARCGVALGTLIE